MSWGRWLRRALLASGLLAVTLFLVLSIVPAVAYRPWCHAEGTYIEGPQRTVWVDQIETLMDEGGMLHVRRGDHIYQPYFETFDGWFVGEQEPVPVTRFGIRRNMEWRIVSFMVHDVRLWDEAPIEPVSALHTAMRDRAPVYGIDPPIDTIEEKAIYDDCVVKRAAAIRVETLD